MKPIGTIVSAVLLAMLACSRGDAAGENQPASPPGPGNEISADLPRQGGTMKVYLPSNYSPDQKWPAIFFYHGMGGRPDTSIPRKYTDGKDYIVAGMPYVDRDDIQIRTPQDAADHAKRELDNFHSARTWLVQHAKVDEKRIFIGGVSKGGWTATMLGEYEHPQLAGLIVLLAGRQRSGGLPKGIAGIKGKPIYIGDGETDLNVIKALQAADFYRRFGAVVTTEIYPGIGHEMPAEAPRLRLWLLAQGQYHQQGIPEAVKEELRGKTKEAAGGEGDILARYSRLLDVLEDPRLSLCGKAQAGEASNQVARLRSQSPVKEEWTAERTFNDLAWLDSNLKSLDDMKAVRDGLKKLSETHPQTRYGKFAARYYELAAEAYDKSVEATRKQAESMKGAPGKPVTPRFGGDETTGTKPLIKYKTK